MKRVRHGVIWGVLVCGAMQAHAVGRLADVRIVDRDSGATLRQYHYRGEIWVAGTPGARYAIALSSRAGERVLAVASVDGVNVLSGETAGWDQGGYVLSPRQSYQVTGWRKSHSEVAAFTFADAAASYAGLTGRADNIGVVGVALFREKLQAAAAPAPEALIRQDGDRLSARRERAADGPAPAAPAQQRAERSTGSNADAADRATSSGAAQGKALPEPVARLGTGHGEREASWVAATRFERAQPRPDEVIRIRYDSRENLLALGVIPAPYRPPLPLQADPFPQSEQARYVPDPPPQR
ncbi:MAG: hypothetical protein ABJA49_14385 [Betaproteobacteria bacterium]